MHSGNDVKKLSNGTVKTCYSSHLAPFVQRVNSESCFAVVLAILIPRASDNLISILSNWKLISCIHPPYPVLI